MMKRIAALCLCLCLISMGAACETPEITPQIVPDDGPLIDVEYATPEPEITEEEELYLFLNIPFGSTKEEVIRLAKANGGVELGKESGGWREGDVRLAPSEGQIVRISEKKVSIWLNADEERGLYSVCILANYFYDSIQELLDELPDALKLLERFEESFGEDANEKSIRWMTTNDGKKRKYPAVEGTQDLDGNIIRNELEQNLGVTLDYYWNNVRGTMNLSALRFSEADPISSWTVGVLITYDDNLYNFQKAMAYIHDISQVEQR